MDKLTILTRAYHYTLLMYEKEKERNDNYRDKYDEDNLISLSVMRSYEIEADELRDMIIKIKDKEV
ncbi:hypothetical protein [Dielma fastidiosa]|uniref:hypothetical protein n=1 Tax=Dielma fastidiosa TaxID=1034346 RepID=UPI000E4E5553|nr:hypothetical protein [Dielma fastidiosa]RHN00868.1 hypothetical protein DWZ33_08535 [Dielma fastidiosa]